MGPGIGDEKDLRRRCERGKAGIATYLITLSETPGNRLEILPAVLLFQKQLRKRVPMIIGAAQGRKEALELVVQIVMERDCFIPEP